jgi:hypothetical protein
MNHSYYFQRRISMPPRGHTCLFWAGSLFTGNDTSVTVALSCGQSLRCKPHGRRNRLQRPFLMRSNGANGDGQKENLTLVSQFAAEFPFI